MSHQINKSELFVTLSDEQQELVAGGIGKKTGGFGGDSPLTRIAGSNYGTQMSAVQGTNRSGPGGSGSTSAALNNKMFTSSLDKLKSAGGIGTLY